MAVLLFISRLKERTIRSFFSIESGRCRTCHENISSNFAHTILKPDHLIEQRVTSTELIISADWVQSLNRPCNFRKFLGQLISSLIFSWASPTGFSIFFLMLYLCGIGGRERAGKGIKGRPRPRLPPTILNILFSSQLKLFSCYKYRVFSFPFTVFPLFPF